MPPPHGPSLPAPKGTDLNKRFAEELGALLGPDFPQDIGLAVSGGGDSMAMLHLAAPWARVMGIRLRVATVDHGLRTESAAEAAMVAETCAHLGLSHSTLKWDGWVGQGNLQAAARQARHELLNTWRGDIRHILFAHTQDDQAETFLMRLARGSGVEGLSAMPRAQEIKDNTNATWTLLRPLLTTTRQELRHYNRVLHIPFVDDPSNADPRFDRVKARSAMEALAPLGLTSQTLADTAARMERARKTLERRADQAARDCVNAAHYDVQFNRDGFSQLERDTKLRLLARALQYVSSNPYRPRASALEDLLDRALGGGDGVLHGGHVLVRRDKIWVIREAKALETTSQKTGPNSTWDSRFICHGPEIKGLQIRALGEDGIAQLKDRPADIPRAVLRVTPAIFDKSELKGCFRLGYGLPYVEELRPNPPMFGAQTPKP